MPPSLIRDTSAIAEYIAVPAFASTDATILHFDGSDRAFHVVIGAREVCQIMPLDSSWPQMCEDLEQMAQTQAFVLSSFLIFMVERFGQIKRPI